MAKIRLEGQAIMSFSCQLCDIVDELAINFTPFLTIALLFETQFEDCTN